MQQRVYWGEWGRLHRLLGRAVQGHDRSGGVLELCDFNVFGYSRSNCFVHAMCDELVFPPGKHTFDAVHVPQRLYWADWSSVHQLRGRMVQGLSRTGVVCVLRRRQVFYCSGRHLEHMHPVSCQLELTWGQRGCNELHVQPRAYWVGWWLVHRVRHWTVQGDNRRGSLRFLRRREGFECTRGNIRINVRYMCGRQIRYHGLRIMHGLQQKLV